MIDLLVISQSCLTAVNRAPYRELAHRGWLVEIAIPKRLKQDQFDRAADPRRPDDPPIHELELKGAHPRLLSFEGIGELLRRRDPQIVLVDADPGSRLALEVGWWARRHRRRVVCITCDNMIRSVLGELRRSAAAAARVLMARVLVLFARPFVHYVFVLSSDSREVMRRLGFGERTGLIPLGYDPAVFRPDSAARHRIRRELGLRGLTFAYFGRVMPEKGIHVLLNALHRLRDQPWNLLLDEFSEYPTPYAAELHRLIHELSLTDRVVFFDATHERMADYMNAVDVVVLPSVTTATFREQYGRVVPEAMACGRLVVVSTCGSLPEVAGAAGIVVPENDDAALQHVLAGILDSPEVTERAAPAAIEHALANHSLFVQCDRMQAVFEQWVSPRRHLILPATDDRA